MKTLEGMYDGKGLKIAIVASRFNEFITTKLVGGAEDCLLRHGTDGDDITLAWVPGAFEIPLAAKKLAFSGKYDARRCSDPRFHQPLRLCLCRSFQGHCTSRTGVRSAGTVRRADYRHH